MKTKSLLTCRVRRVCSVLLFAPLASLLLSGCIAVGHSTGGGWFIWPGGGLGLVVVVLLVLFLLRRR